MEKAKKSRLIILFMRGIIPMERKTEKGNYFLLTALNMKGILLIIILKVSEYINGLMGNVMKENGKEI